MTDDAIEQFIKENAHYRDNVLYPSPGWLHKQMKELLKQGKISPVDRSTAAGSDDHHEAPDNQAATEET